MEEEKLRLYQIPKKLRKVLPKGEYAVYRMLGAEWIGDRFSGRTAGIPPRDSIMDGDGNVYPIGLVSGYTPEGEPQFGDIRFAVEDFCQIVLRSGAKDAAKYDFMENTNYNLSNPNRDPTMDAAFERVTSTTGAKDSRVVRGNKIKALDIAMSLTEAELISFVKSNINRQGSALSLGSLPNGDIDFEQVRDSVEAFAEANPTVFLELNVSTPESESDESFEGLVDEAVKNNVIKFDRETKQWFNAASGKPFLRVISIKNGVPKKELLVWLRTAEGANVLAKLEEK